MWQKKSSSVNTEHYYLILLDGTGNMNLEALTQPITKVNYSKEREFGKGAWGELTGYTLNTPCFMIP